MHDYSIDSDIRKKVMILLFILSFILSIFINGCINSFKPAFDNILNEHQTFKKIIDFIVFCGVIEFSPLIIYGLLYSLFNRILWKYLSPILGIPNINGEWCGTLISSFKKKGELTEIDMKLIVKQTWEEISFHATYLNSESTSSTSSIQINASQKPIIAFSFINDSSDVKLKTKKYDGYNILTANGTKMSGRYFTNRENGTVGTINLEKKNPKNINLKSEL